MDEILIDTPYFRYFAEFDMVCGQIPDETTILNFRHLLEKRGIVAQIFETVKETPNKAGPALLADLNLIRETSLHNFAA